MTKKNLIALAETIRGHNHRNPNAPFTAEQLETLADFCSFQNPNFKRQRWFDYIAGICGPNGGAR